VIRILKIVAGFALLGGGIAMLVLPGPGWLTIFGALALLAAEFAWARRALDRLRDAGSQVARTVTRGTDRVSEGNETHRSRGG
jgi:uncharacterized protein (TIGR02611 family)